MLNDSDALWKTGSLKLVSEFRVQVS